MNTLKKINSLLLEFTHEKEYSRALKRRDNPRNKADLKEYAKAAVEELSKFGFNNIDKCFIWY